MRWRTDLSSFVCFEVRGKAHHYAAAFRGVWTLSTNECNNVGPTAGRGKKQIGGDECSLSLDDPISRNRGCALCLRWAAEVAAWPASEISGGPASKTLLEGRGRHVRAPLQCGPAAGNFKAEAQGRCKPLLTVSMSVFILSAVSCLWITIGGLVSFLVFGEHEMRRGCVYG